MKAVAATSVRAAWLAVALALSAAGCGGTGSNPAAEAPRAVTDAPVAGTSDSGASNPSPTTFPGEVLQGVAAPAPLRVAAASDLQVALPALAEAFQSESGIEVSPTFGASGQLAEQIRAGAPFDVFLAANQKFVTDLAEGGFVWPDTVHPYARGTLVLVVHREAGGSVQGLRDLAGPGVKKVALANPAFAPYGAAGKQALERAGLWAQVESKIVQASSVRQALQFVQSGNAEAGLVGRSIADVPEVRAVAVDPQLYDPIMQSLGVVARTEHPKEAEAFARFVLGDKGRAVLARHGLSPVETAR